MREFAIKRYNGDNVIVKQGKDGYFPAQLDDTEAALFNQDQGNTENDLVVAERCSIYGWDTPLARQLTSSN